MDAWEAERERIRAPYERLSEVCSNLSDKLTELVDRIGVRPSRSWSGLVAKAGVIKTAISEEVRCPRRWSLRPDGGPKLA